MKEMLYLDSFGQGIVMTTCLNKKKKKSLKKTRQAIEIIIDVLVQEQKAHPFLKNVDLEFVKETLQEQHQSHYPTYKDPEKFRESVEKFFRELKENEVNRVDLIEGLGSFFSKSCKKEKVMERISHLQKILELLISLFTVISIVLAWIKGYLTVLTFQHRFSSFETNKASKHILRERK